MADVAHSTLTGADLHEPKGADAATANQIYVADGAGSGTWTSLSALELPGRWKLINTFTPSATANQSITGFNSALYRDYRIVLDHISPTTNNAALNLRASSNGGASFASGSSAYRFAVGGVKEGVATVEADVNTFIRVALDVSDSANYGVCGVIHIINPGASTTTSMTHQVAYRTGSSASVLTGGANVETPGATDAIQLFFNAGNISSGTIRFYGLGL